MDTPKLTSDMVLTMAETRVASGYVSGYIGKEIAARCGMSYNTVVKHTQDIYDKTGIRRCTNALVAWFLSVNEGIDLGEYRRRFGAGLLLCLLLVQFAADPSGDNYVRRTPARRVERTRGRKSRQEDEVSDIFDLI